MLPIHARTDRTFACVDCAVRLWPTTRCPRCGERASLVDLASRDAKPALRELLPGPAFLARQQPVIARGRVRALGPLLRAPLSGRACVAWVIEAALPSGAVLDATGSRFEVVGPTRAWIVDGETGSYLLDVDPAPWTGVPPEATHETLSRFLGARGLLVQGLAEARFVERIVARDAHVEARGVRTTTAPASSGYRGSEAIEVLGDARGAPLRVTLLPEPAEGG